MEIYGRNNGYYMMGICSSFIAIARYYVAGPFVFIRASVCYPQICGILSMSWPPWEKNVNHSIDA